MPSIRPEAASCCSRGSSPASASRSRSIAGLDASSSITLPVRGGDRHLGAHRRRALGDARQDRHARQRAGHGAAVQHVAVAKQRGGADRRGARQPAEHRHPRPQLAQPLEQRLGREAVRVGEHDHAIAGGPAPRRRRGLERSRSATRDPTRKPRRPAPPRSGGWRSRPPASTPPRRPRRVPPRSRGRRRPRRRPRSRSDGAARAARGRRTGSTCRGPGGERPRTAGTDRREHPASGPPPGPPPRTPPRRRSSPRVPRRSCTATPET